MRDFTLTIYRKLLSELLHAGYGFVTFAEYIQDSEKNKKTLILRHDVDKKPLRSLRTAEIENELGLKGTYYFRVIKNKLPGKAIEFIAKLGHEIGYHYDDLNDASGVEEKALELFKKNLAKLREVAPVKTACMHGSPLSKHDNRNLWKNFDYRDLGIIGEPYFDIDFNEVMYLTDTGRRWDGEGFSIRDKVVSSEKLVFSSQDSVDSSKKSVVSSKKKETTNKLKLHSTIDIIGALRNDLLPSTIMLTVHPQRWNDQWLPWIWELCWQKVKNFVKYFVVRRSS
ncbi:MAG: hypothetical protein MUO31_06025 [Thermodesulfovibrionales bacterium]|nr:hypothetical protein [Thermodesulfovibrionales bacterium]